ncbi:MAG: hypothetical protein COV52_01205 [Gammaproteobacteria bacterium CG11_big_fil_rev_8_21_14_0_20_46_22]|nr:MAG: hypothetical protein COW05_02385 [Gammaproteobacteria bacterium CG12_big_fil_rev_8_21_14_0_65_46_12]PIR11946.1 MAG: hypothetical protein COV52_01205 [Gammaproteobacteria bacterium CG11_big_fil_rev_8_21_14_0_20_46_22]
MPDDPVAQMKISRSKILPLLSRYSNKLLEAFLVDACEKEEAFAKELLIMAIKHKWLFKISDDDLTGEEKATLFEQLELDETLSGLKQNLKQKSRERQRFLKKIEKKVSDLQQQLFAILKLIPNSIKAYLYENRTVSEQNFIDEWLEKQAAGANELHSWLLIIVYFQTIDECLARLGYFSLQTALRQSLGEMLKFADQLGWFELGQLPEYEKCMRDELRKDRAPDHRDYYDFLRLFDFPKSEKGQQQFIQERLLPMIQDACPRMPLNKQTGLAEALSLLQDKPATASAVLFAELMSAQAEFSPNSPGQQEGKKLWVDQDGVAHFVRQSGLTLDPQGQARPMSFREHYLIYATADALRDDEVLLAKGEEDVKFVVRLGSAAVYYDSEGFFNYLQKVFQSPSSGRNTPSSKSSAASSSPVSFFCEKFWRPPTPPTPLTDSTRTPPGASHRSSGSS